MNLDLLHDLPALETERLTLRALTLDDAADVFEYARDEQVTRYTTWEPHRSIEDSKQFLARVIADYAQGSPSVWGIVLRAQDKIVGTIGFVTIDPLDYRGEVGYAIGRAYWGQGYTTEAARAVIKFGFDQICLNRIEAMCEPANIGSARVMEKAGMQYEGILRQYVFDKDKFRDLKIYSILRSEWNS